MTTVSDMLYQFGGTPVGSALGDIALMGGKAYFFDPTRGTAGADGETPASANSSLLLMYNRLRDGYGDGVVFVGGATAWNPTAMLTWAKNYSFLWGTNSIPGVGNRCRIVAQAAAALTVPFTLSGAGNIVRNVQISNEKAAGAAAGCAIISGLRNIIENTFFMSPVATDAASYSCKLTAAENTFVRSTFGQLTNPRTAASYGLWIEGAGNVSRTKLIQSEFLSWGYNADHVHIRFDADLAAVPTVTWIEDCLFDHVGTQLTQAIDDNCVAADHQIVFRGHNNAILNAAAVGDVLTYMFVQDQGTTPSGLLMSTVAES